MEVEFRPKGIESVFIANDLHSKGSLLADVEGKLFDERHLVGEIEVLRSSDDVFELLGGDRDGLVI
jgi:hypothetical protein